MKVIIQCAGRKRKEARRWRDAAGVEVLFIARPDLRPQDVTSPVLFSHPDEPVGSGLGTWREALLFYNRDGEQL